MVLFRELERVTSRRSAALALTEDVEDGALYAAMVQQEVATVDEEGKGDELTWSKNVQEKTKTTRSVEAPLARECQEKTKTTRSVEAPLARECGRVA
jgi:hypothetical protein